MEILLYILVCIVGCISGIITGITGGGGAMLMIPAYILSGLPPQVAVATAKLSGLGGDFGGLFKIIKSKKARKDVVKIMIPIAIVIGIITPIIFTVVESKVFQIFLGAFMLATLPLLFIKNTQKRFTTRKHKGVGYFLYSCVLFLQSIFSGGVGSLAIYVLTYCFGTSRLETVATRRLIVAYLSPITIIALLFSGFIHIWLGLAGLIAAYFGTKLGTHLAFKRSEQFVTYVMAIVIVLSSIVLFITA